MKFKRFGALLVSSVLCIGMAFPAFAYGGESIPQPEETELPVMVLEEETGPLTPEGNLLPGDRPEQQRGADRAFHEPGG